MRFLYLVLGIFVIPTFVFGQQTLDELREEAVESTKKNEVIMPDLPNYDNETIIKKRCDELGLNDEECKIKIKEYKIHKYKENRYVEPGLGSQEHN